MAIIPSTDAPISPTEMLEKAIKSGITKSNLPLTPIILQSVLAGMYIAFGAAFAAVVATGANGTLPYGLMKLLQGVVFSLGLILVLVGGAELFTGNMLMVIALLDHKIRIGKIARNWSIVYLGNLIGSLLIAIFMVLGKTYQFAGGEFGRLLLSIASGKLQYGFLQAVVLGILCNILVCLAVWLTYSAKNTTDKIMAIIFPIAAFIAAGFEHSVANMYIIPVAIILKSVDPSFVAGSNLNLASLDWVKFLDKKPATGDNRKRDWRCVVCGCGLLPDLQEKHPKLMTLNLIAGDVKH